MRKLAEEQDFNGCFNDSTNGKSENAENTADAGLGGMNSHAGGADSAGGRTADRRPEEADCEGAGTTAADTSETDFSASDAAGDDMDMADDGMEDADAEADSDAGASDEKRFFKKKAKPDKKQDAMKQKMEELEDRVKRQMAEFDNFRKRSEKEKTTMFETGAKSVIEKILPVVDNFERGLATVPEEERGSGFADGMQMIYKQLMTELDNLGVKPIEAVGQEFDPVYHNAVMQVESEEYDSGIIAQELQKGYMYRDTVVRHSMVAVVS